MGGCGVPTVVRSATTAFCEGCHSRARRRHSQPAGVPPHPGTTPRAAAMRVATEERLVRADPGSTIDLVVDVVNTGDLIDGITAHLIGLPEGRTTVEPKVLPLFPDAQGQIRLSVDVPSTQPAGLHPLTVEVVSHGGGTPTQHVDVELSVSARPAIRLTASPRTVR